MWLNQLFMDTPIDFEKRCRRRIAISAGLVVLGAVSILIVLLTQGQIPVLYLEPNTRDFIPGFYTGLGGGLIGAGIISILKNRRYLKNPEEGKKRKIMETDERNRMLGLRCWAYAGYSMFLLLYVGILIGGFISVTVVKVLLGVGAVYGLLLLGFRLMLQRAM